MVEWERRKAFGASLSFDVVTSKLLSGLRAKISGAASVGGGSRSGARVAECKGGRRAAGARGDGAGRVSSSQGQVPGVARRAFETYVGGSRFRVELDFGYFGRGDGPGPARVRSAGAVGVSSGGPKLGSSAAIARSRESVGPAENWPNSPTYSAQGLAVQRSADYIPRHGGSEVGLGELVAPVNAVRQTVKKLLVNLSVITNPVPCDAKATCSATRLSSQSGWDKFPLRFAAMSAQIYLSDTIPFGCGEIQFSFYLRARYLPEASASRLSRTP
ncbi:hypothetical protein EVAR_75638_1 [Eumeta japonica]|uniref:Uncharacterized protein n=1 Tax=Eumeta variegata TaxID=151549 RepID=A0A4C1U1G1_EUMVA|nr:hypothetical protein EVAR_75638_1 [Eumeta japonica]